MPRRLTVLCRALFVACTLSLFSPLCGAQVMVFDAEVEARALAEPLRIQLGQDTVQRGQANLSDVTRPERAQKVAQALRQWSNVENEPLLGLWLEPSIAAEGTFVVFVVSIRAPTLAALVQRFELRADAQSERALALTIAELYRRLARQSSPTMTASVPPQPKALTRESEAVTLRGVLAAGQMVRSLPQGLSPLLSLQLDGGGEWSWPRTRLRAYLGGYLQLPRTHTLAAGSVDYEEQCALLGIGGVLRLGALEPGATVELRATRFRTGATFGKRTGEVTKLAGSAAVHGLAALSVSRSVRLELSGGVALQLKPALFTVFGNTVANIPRVVPEARLMISFAK